MKYTPGAMLGITVLVAGQTTLGWPRLTVIRITGLLLSCTIAWRLAIHLRLTAAPLPWIAASLAGALGAGGGTLLAWPQQVHAKPLLIRLTLMGIISGTLFLLLAELHLLERRSGWSLGVLWIWQTGLLGILGSCLRPRVP